MRRTRIISGIVAFMMATTPFAGVKSGSKLPAQEAEVEEEYVESEGAYEHVVVIGVDGAGAFFKEADTPNIDKIFKNGAVTYDCLTSNPTISAECWGSLLLGVTPEFHNLNNSVVSSNERNSKTEYPSIFRLVREAEPDAKLAAFSNWNPINSGIIEWDIGVHKETGYDLDVKNEIVAYLEENEPRLMFVQFDGADHTGHESGYGTAEHLETIHTIDGYIGEIYDALKKKGMLDDTLFIVTADHGGYENSHGGWTDEEKYVMFAAVGKTVAKGEIKDMEIRDTASIVLYALGLTESQTERMTSRVPSGLFKGVEATERPVFTIEYAYDYRTAESTETPALADGIVGVLGEDRVTAYYTFDNNCEDRMGNYETSTSGKIYYPEGFYGTGARFDDGYAKIENYTTGDDSFSFAFWMKTEGTDGDPAILSNKDWENGFNPGYVLSLSGNNLIFNYGDGNDRVEPNFLLPEDYRNGWVYVVVVINRTKGYVALSYDFSKLTLVRFNDGLVGKSMDAFPNLCFGQDGTGAYKNALTAELDELVIVSGTLTNKDIEKIRDFYVK